MLTDDMGSVVMMVCCMARFVFEIGECRRALHMMSQIHVYYPLDTHGYGDDSLSSHASLKYVLSAAE